MRPALSGRITSLPMHGGSNTLNRSGYKLRFSGCFVADVHQILHKGGVFTYPGIQRKGEGKTATAVRSKPHGNDHPCRPAGRSATGRSDILDITPGSIDEVTPIYVGGKKEIALIEKFMNEG